MSEQLMLNSTGLEIASYLARIASNYGSESLASRVDQIEGNLENLMYTNAGSHNAVYRGKCIGTSLTSSQVAAIYDGSFDDIYPGDYWTINSVNWIVGDCDYYYNMGDTQCTTHHVLVFPETTLYDAQMNTSNTTNGGYVASAMYTSNLANAKTTINSAFGSSHVLSHRRLFANACTDGKETGWAWVNSTVDLMSECQVYGNWQWRNYLSLGYGGGVDYRQISAFRHNPNLIVAFNGTSRKHWWLRDVSSSTNFCNVSAYGDASVDGASYSFGVRPAFLIY